jgi:hypothetical protein
VDRHPNGSAGEETSASLTYLVERYRPGLTDVSAGALVRRDEQEAAAMRAEGAAIRILQSTLVAADEVLLSLVAATTRAEVEELARRSGALADRVIPAEDLSR